MMHGTTNIKNSFDWHIRECLRYCLLGIIFVVFDCWNTLSVLMMSALP